MSDNFHPPSYWHQLHLVVSTQPAADTHQIVLASPSQSETVCQIYLGIAYSLRQTQSECSISWDVCNAVTLFLVTFSVRLSLLCCHQLSPLLSSMHITHLLVVLMALVVYFLGFT